MQKKLSTYQLILLSSGGMLGCGWLFSPFYGYQTAGIGVLYSWLITAIITFIIGLSFAEVCSALPLAGSIYRLIGITHNKNTASIFLILGWLSYVVYLPLEAQAVIQYLGFWMPFLVKTVNTQVELSWQGILLAMVIILGITWFNTLIITKVATVNNWVSLWKISIPIIVALIAIIGFGSWHKFTIASNFTNFTYENVLLAITTSGLAFAFSGFQNGLLLANQVKHPDKAIPHSLIWPIILGLVLYSLISLSYLATLNGHDKTLLNATAPLLGLLSLLGLNALFTILFIDAIIAPLGTTNVYIAVTSRILYAVGKELRPSSFLTKLNQHKVPYIALWINAVVGIIFLFPFPTWKELVTFLSSIVVFAYLAGPISLVVLRNKQLSLNRKFSLKYPYLVGLGGFVCCNWLIYWSGLTNLAYLWLTLLIVIIGYLIISHGVLSTVIRNIYLLVYVGSLWCVSFLHQKHLVSFPLDNVLVAIIAVIFFGIFIKNSLGTSEIQHNLTAAQTEMSVE